MSKIRRIGEDAYAFIGRVTQNVALVSVGCLLALVLIITSEVVLRHGFNRPTSWGVEVSEYLMLYLVFAAVAYTLFVDKHVSADLLTTRLPRKAQDWLKLLSGLVVLCVSVILTWKTGELTNIALVEDWHSTTQLRIFLFPIYLAMPLGSLLLSLVSVFKIYIYCKILLAGGKAIDGK